MNGAVHATTIQRRWGVLEQINNVVTAPHSSPSLAKTFSIYRLFMKDDGTYPNNKHHPLLLFQSAFVGDQKEGERIITTMNRWTTPWVWGVFTYHHYHSTAWELLVCFKGSAVLQLGGDTGPKVTVAKGDVILIPPGFAHKQLSSSSNGFALLGAYLTSGCTGPVDVLRGVPTKEQLMNIEQCVPPKYEPVTGIDISELYSIKGREECRVEA